MITKKNILYVCAYGESRSKTLADITNNYGKYNADYCGYLDDAEKKLTNNMMDNADYIII